MAISQQIQNQAAIIRAKIASSNDLDEDYKARLFDLVALTAMATNGISQEEKIQKMTEAMHSLTMSQIEFITHINKTVTKSLEESSKKIETMIATTQQTIQTTIANATISHCKTCKAMEHAEEIEKEKEYAKLIQEMGGVVKDDSQAKSQNWSDFLQKTCSKILIQPWIWIFFAVVSISPYGVNIINAVKDLF